MLLNAAQTLELIDQKKFNLCLKKKIKRNVQKSFINTGVCSSTSIKLMIMLEYYV
jgi:hypothetical protein